MKLNPAGVEALAQHIRLMDFGPEWCKAHPWRDLGHHHDHYMWQAESLLAIYFNADTSDEGGSLRVGA